MVAPSVSMDEVVSALQQLQISRYLAGVALVLCLYDWILLFGDEYMTIWKTRWTLPKGIYYFNRTVTPIGLIMANFQLSELKTEPLSETFCTVYGYTMGLAELVSFFLCNLLLTLRLVALYKRKRWVCWFLYTFLVISYVIAAVLVVWTFRVYGQTIHYSQMLHVCGSETRSPLMPAIFFVPSVFEFTIFFMTGYRAWQDAKKHNKLVQRAVPHHPLPRRYHCFLRQLWLPYLEHLDLRNPAIGLRLDGSLSTMGNHDYSVYARLPQPRLPRAEACYRGA